MTYESSRRPCRKPQEHRITGTDRIHARLTLRDEVVVEFTRDNFGSLSSLLGALRAVVPHLAGLARLSIRNMTRGWTMERPLMLYKEPYFG